jgi:DNA polymerase-1
MRNRRFDVALIEADELVHTYTAGCQADLEHDGQVFLHTPVREVVGQIVEEIHRILDLAGADRACLAFSCPSDEGYRRTLFPGYKANRRDRKPAGFHHVRDYLRMLYWTRELPGLEADDVLGLGVPDFPLERQVRVSKDKDLLTVPGWLLRNDVLLNVSEAAADEAFYRQILAGDSTDGYPGCPRVGATGAEKEVSKFGTGRPGWERIVLLYRKQGLTEEDALVQARLARILRPGEYDPEGASVHLWQPPNDLHDPESNAETVPTAAPSA